ncbi:MAG: ATP-dependent DNA helicase, partial [Candidatus Saccharimonadales bacterium]
MARRTGKKLVLVAPTGLAARRLSTVSNHPASTIHRWLGQVEKGLDDEDLPDIVVIDECSMLSSTLAYNVLKAAYTTAGKIVLVGDPHQLPPIEPGSPFKDILDYNIIPTTSLEKIWRQKGGSVIPIIAGLVRNGKRPDTLTTIGKQNQGWRYTECPTAAAVEKEAAIESIRQHKAFLDKGGNVSLSPMYQYEGGVERLGSTLQRNLNTNPKKILKGEKGEWRVGDPCLHVGNDYAKNLTHAMRGVIVDLKTTDKLPLLIIHWEDDITRSHPCKDGDGGRIVLGYVLTYHRSQGSEYPGVTIALTKRQLAVANREAIYTAITRAKT